jgi:hypothetical protein
LPPVLLDSNQKNSTISHGVFSSIYISSDLDLKRLNTIKETQYSSFNPFVQEQPPNFVIYPPLSRQTRLNYFSNINKIVNNQFNAWKAEKKRNKNSCNICNEHKLVAEYLWNNYFKTAHKDPKFTGKYLEMGALDALSGSTSLFFDGILHWEGLLIEPNPPNFAELWVNRPHAFKLEMAACLCPNSLTIGPDRRSCNSLEFLGDYGGTAGYVESMSKSFRKVFHGVRTQTYRVSCAPLSFMLAETGRFLVFDSSL